MKNSVVLILVILSVSIDASAQTYGLGNADPAVFSRFTIPETNLNSLWFNTNFSFSSQSHSNLFDTGPNYNSVSQNLSYALSPRYYLLRESDDRYFQISGILSGSYSYSDGRSEGSGVPLNSFHKQSYDALSLNLSQTLRNYAHGSDLFYSIGSNVQLYLNDQRNDVPTSDSTRMSSYYGYKDQIYGLSIGFGWGKMRDVTSVVSAIRFQERLKQLNLLNSDLSEKAIEDLAQQFYRQGYFSQVHVRPDKFFWQGVDNTLSADGVSLGGLNEYAASYLRETPGEVRFSRNEGLVGGVNMALNYTNDYYSAQSNPPSGSITEELLVLANAYVNFSHQLDLNSQFRFNLLAQGGPNLTKHPGIRQQYEITGGVGYDYELTDRVVASANNKFDLLFQNSARQGKQLSNVSSLSVSYFIEDDLSFGAHYTLDYEEYKGWENSLGHSRETDNYVSLGFTYYLDRGMLYSN
jgi:hypothetical protein